MSATHEVQFKARPDDLRAFDRFVADGAGRWEGWPLADRLMILLIGCFGCFVAWTINEAMGIAASSALPDLSWMVWMGFAFLSGLILGGYVGYLLCLAMAKWGFSRWAVLKEQHDLYREGVSVSITPEGVALFSPVFFRRHAWRAVRDIVQTGNHLFLRTGRYEGVIIPRSAFDTDQAFYDCAHLCVGYFDGANAADPQRPRMASASPGPGAITLPPSVTLKPH